MEDTSMHEQTGSSNPRILWGEAAASDPMEHQQGEPRAEAPAPAPANPLAAAAALLQEGREKHEKRCVSLCSVYTARATKRINTNRSVTIYHSIKF